jgi:hypothetical protein
LAITPGIAIKAVLARTLRGAGTDKTGFLFYVMWPFGLGDLKRMQWMLDHWFEITTTVLLIIIAINTLDGKWNNSTIVEQLNDLIRSFSSRARREAVLRSHSSSQSHLEISDDGQAQP